jgi:transcription-repair coupling factor (superfamily II helicase)
MLSRDAQKRLRVIQDFSEPGAGFKVATHDLEIRGGGNLLGMSQSGHISAVGYELYTELMEKTIGELRGERVAEKEIRPEINFGLAAYIPDDYIEDVQRRLMAYKKISLAASDENLAGLKDELVDCYGALPSEVANLMAVIAIRNQLKEMMIRKMEYNGTHLFVAFHEDSAVNPQKIVDLVRSNAIQGMKFSPDLTLHVPMPGLVGDEIMTRAKDLLDRLKH